MSVNNKSAKLEKQLKDGVELFHKNSLNKALTIFKDIIDNDGKNEEAYFYVGNIFHIQGKLGKAVKAFNKVLKLNPNHTDSSIALSVILNDIGHYDQAKKVFNQAQEHVKKENNVISDPHINQKFANKHLELAQMYSTYNRFDEALFEYNKASALDEKNLEVRIKIAKVYSKKGFISKSFEVLRKLKSEHPEYIPCRTALGLLHYGSGNILEAQTEWRNALQKDPKNEEVSMYLKLSNNATETNLKHTDEVQ